MRLSRVLLRESANKARSGASGDPYHVLGVPHGTPMEEIKTRYKKLAAKYHPDMPSGDANRFREITAAYTLLKAGQLRKKAGAEEDGGQSTVNSAGRETWEWKRAHSAAAAANRAPSPQELLWVDGRLEMYVTLAATFFFGFAIWDRQSVGSTRQQQMDRVSMDNVQTPSLDADASARGSPRPLYRLGEYRGDAAPSTDRFNCFKDFLFGHDARNALRRKHSVSHFGAEHVVEKTVASRCPIVVKINTTTRGHSEYVDHLAAAVDRVRSIPWAHIDAGEAGVLGLVGAARVPNISPSATRWTFIEHRDAAAGAGGSLSTPECIVAVLNEKYPSGVGMARRITISGSDDMHKELVVQRGEDLRSGKLRHRQLVTGGVVPVKDLGEQHPWT